jgi:chromosome segregation ATPase
MAGLTGRLDSTLIDAETRIQQLNQELERLDSALPSQRHNLDADIDKHLAELDSWLNRLATDIRSAPNDSKSYYQHELELLRDQYSQIATELQRKRLAAGSSIATRQSE